MGGLGESSEPNKQFNSREAPTWQVAPADDFSRLNGRENDRLGQHTQCLSYAAPHTVVTHRIIWHTAQHTASCGSAHGTRHATRYGTHQNTARPIHNTARGSQNGPCHSTRYTAQCRYTASHIAHNTAHSTTHGAQHPHSICQEFGHPVLPSTPTGRHIKVRKFS